jgi:hypothetical protein
VEYEGAIHKTSPSKRGQEDVPTISSQYLHHLAQVEYAQGKGM